MKDSFAGSLLNKECYSTNVAHRRKSDYGMNFRGRSSSRCLKYVYVSSSYEAAIRKAWPFNFCLIPENHSGPEPSLHFVGRTDGRADAMCATLGEQIVVT